MWLLQLSTTSQIFVMVAAVEYAIVELIFRAESRIKDAVASLPREKGEADGGRDDGADESAGSAPAPTALPARRRGCCHAHWCCGRCSGCELVKSSPAGQLQREDYEAVVARIGRLDVLLMTNRATVRLRHQHLDTFMRYAYPLAYSIVIGVWFGRVSDVQAPEPWHSC